MKILALDQSSRISGYAIFNNNKLEKSGTFTARAKDIDQRLEQIRIWVKTLIKAEDIEKVVLEDIQLENNIGNNVITYKMLAEVIGVITELLVELGLEYEIIAPSVWRKKLSLWAPNRAMCKQKAKDYVLAKYNLRTTEDTCDAICIGEATLNSSQKQIGFDWS